MFANLSQGSLVYLLNLKGDNIKYSTGSIETVSYMSPFNNLMEYRIAVHILH